MKMREHVGSINQHEVSSELVAPASLSSPTHFTYGRPWLVACFTQKHGWRLSFRLCFLASPAINPTKLRHRFLLRVKETSSRTAGKSGNEKYRLSLSIFQQYQIKRLFRVSTEFPEGSFDVKLSRKKI